MFRNISWKSRCTKVWMLLHKVVITWLDLSNKGQSFFTPRCTRNLSNTPATAEILCIKNKRTIVVCVFLIKWYKKYAECMKKNRGSCWELPAVVFNTQLPNISHNFFSYFQHYFQSRTHKPQLSSHFWHIIFQV